jgi:catechol 2,3-dioxygenase-like lactoylglutathione lyase family enzyme
VDVLSSPILVRPGDLDRSLRFYRDVLGLAVYREFGPPDHPGTVFFLGQRLLEVSGQATGPAERSVMSWIQVRDVRREHARLAAAGVPVIREPVTEPWGLAEMWIEDPDGIRIVLVEVPPATLSSVTHGRRHRRSNDRYAATEDTRPDGSPAEPCQSGAVPVHRPAPSQVDVLQMPSRSLSSLMIGQAPSDQFEMTV